MSQTPNKITIIGGGNLGSAIALGLVKSGYLEPSKISITRHPSEKIDDLEEMGFAATTNNVSAVKNADIVLLAVKPWQVVEVLEEINSSFSENAIVISLAAGVSISQLSKITGERSIFRVIPNTAISVRESMTCISHENSSDEQVELVENLFKKVGKVMVIPEEMMEAVTVLASSGTAFALRYLHASAQAGTEMGIRPSDAIELAAQTIKGAAALILSSKNHPEIEIDKVTTPGGVTIKGLNAMEERGFSASVIGGMIEALKVMKK